MSDAILHHLAVARRRRLFLSPSAARENCWMILLDLARAARERRRMDITSACLSGGMPSTTGLRGVNVLLAEGLAQREPDPKDGRRQWLSITDRGMDAVRQVLSVPEGKGEKWA